MSSKLFHDNNVDSSFLKQLEDKTLNLNALNSLNQELIKNRDYLVDKYLGKSYARFLQNQEDLKKIEKRIHQIDATKSKLNDQAKVAAFDKELKMLKEVQAILGPSTREHALTYNKVTMTVERLNKLIEKATQLIAEHAKSV